MASATEDAEAQRLRIELEHLRQRLSSCKTVHDLFLLTEKAAYVAKTAAAACRKRAADKEPAPAAAGDAEDAEGAANAAADAAVRAGQLPKDDDGVSCLLLRLPKGWGPPRLQAFIERFGAKPASVGKNAGEERGFVKFETAEQRSLFYNEFVKAEQGGSSTGSSGQFQVKFPGGTSGIAVKSGVKRPAGDGAAGDAAARGDNEDTAGGARKRKAKELKSDIREVVCPWWQRPYADQLQDKMGVVNGTLRALAEKVAYSYGREEKPAWLTAALHRPGKQALLLPGIMRSPQLNGYRNKAEFTIGLDGQERPTAGFLMGNYVDGVTQVANPAECRHISPTALAYAAAMSSFLRSSDNQLPVWDKRFGRGFWRLITVREGRSSSFLPLPVPAAAAAVEGEQQQQQQEVLTPCPALAELPVGRWLVKNPELMDDDDQDGLAITQVSEQEPAAPLPSDAIVMVQVDPTAAPGGAEQIAQQLRALATGLKAAAAEKGLPMTALLVQYHSGVANAAPQGTPLTYFPGEEQQQQQQEGAGAGQVGVFSDVLCEVKFRVSPNAFFQVNNGGTCLLYNTVGRMAGVGPSTLLLDVCCGTGTIGITLAKQVAAVIGVDNVEMAIADARVNAELNGITNATFVCDTAENAMEPLLKEHAPKYEHVVAVVDPPRAGLHRSVLRALLACAALKRLVFVSCNPDTLVLNAGLLCAKYRPDGASGGGGRGGRGGRGRHGRQVDALPPMSPYIPFRPIQVACFDLFPHTKHVEVVMLLERE